MRAAWSSLVLAGTLGVALAVVSGTAPAAQTPSAGKHGYFETLTARPDLLVAHSLREPRQFDHPSNGGFAHSNKRELAVTYDREMDAARITVPAGTNSLTNQLRLPIPKHAPRSLFVTWDAWYGKEFEFGVHGIRNYKTFQFGSPFNDIHVEIRNRFSIAPGSAGLVDARLYPEGGYSQGPNVQRADTLEPRKGSFTIRPETWVRYWAFFEAPPADKPDDPWYRFSLWVADTRSGPVEVYDALKVRPSPKSESASWESFWLEFNTSTGEVKPNRPALVAYVRNVVALAGVKDVKPLLVRP